MELYIQSNEMIKKMFECRYQVTDMVSKSTDIAVVVRSNDQEPANIHEIIKQTDGMLPIVVMTGAEDQLGKIYEEIARTAGIPSDYIIRGTEWRMSQVKEILEGIENNPLLPDPKIFMDNEMISLNENNIADSEVNEITQLTPLPSSIQIVSVLGLNGGVGVTTIAASLTAFYYLNGLSTRLIDLSYNADAALHFNLQQQQGIQTSDFGEVAITHSDPNLIQRALDTSSEVIVADLPFYSTYTSQFLEMSQKIIIVINPSEVDYIKLKEYMKGIDKTKAIICINKIDTSKPLRKSFTSLIEQDFNQPFIMSEDSDEVASAYADRKPAYFRYPFENAIQDLAVHIQIS
ncbi:hypothetical protein [Chengkuizengella axinellae]|uniref:CobQ/CobB/MinD/ParA nucleotide binding domain-containing protein n=1 Tax=Chengkuizengella axinellae TaxID=3064388 RepID=A0ABT9J4L1_9BACL|nr:hypothetical protein [Chengkuizengella sp. 2205SS18-9]MDP5276566.1 hypothetical protein [Chengkuizengella sp. 2205SS18-9]